MQLNQDYEELFKVLNAAKIRYLVVGAYAVIYYTKPRYTKDIDIWIPPQLNNADNVFNALKKFGAPLKGVDPKDFQNPAMIYQIGVAPIRIDILMDVLGVDAESAWKNRKCSKYGQTPINILGLKDLKNSKRKAGRKADELDLDYLSNALGEE